MSFPYWEGKRVAGLRLVDAVGTCLINGTVTRVEMRDDGRVNVFVRLDGYDDEKSYNVSVSGRCDSLLPRESKRE